MGNIAETKLREVILKSKSFNDAARTLKTNRPLIQRLVKRYGIDHSHFTFGNRYQELVGKKIQKLTVINVHRDGKRYLATCKCDCGQFTVKRCDNLKYGKTFSCGCHAKNRTNMLGNKNPSFKGEGKIGKVFFSDLRHGAIRRNLEFNITLKYIWELYKKQKGKCSITNVPIHFGRTRMSRETTASLDRIDNSKGYVEGNVRWVLKPINMLRLNYDTEYFIKLCNLVAVSNPRKLDECMV